MASTHLTSPGSSDSFPSGLSVPQLLPISPSIPYFSLCCPEFFFHGGGSFNYSQPFHWQFLSVTVFRWIWLSLPLQPSLSWTSLTAMWGSCPLQPCIKSVAPCGQGCFTAQHPDLSGLPLIHTQVFPLQQFSAALSPSVHLPLCFLHRPPLYLDILTPLQSGCRLYDPDHSLPNPLISYISLMSCPSPSSWTSLGKKKVTQPYCWSPLQIDDHKSEKDTQDGQDIRYHSCGIFTFLLLYFTPFPLIAPAPLPCTPHTSQWE